MHPEFPSVIEPSRRLLLPGVAQQTGMQEAYDNKRQIRTLFLPKGNDDIAEHDTFVSNGFAVLPSEKTDDGLILLVPDGTQTVRQILKSISYDTERYSPLFTQIGYELGKLSAKGYGLSVLEGQTILSSVAFAPTEQSDFGESVFFIPPYTISQGTTVEDSNKNIHSELRQSPYLDPVKARDLMWAILLGFGK